MQAKHRYIWIFGGVCLLYLLIMTIVGKIMIREPDMEEEGSEYVMSRHVFSETQFQTVETTPENDGKSDESQSEGSVVSANEMNMEKSESSEKPLSTEPPAVTKEKKAAPKKEKKPKPTEDPIFYGYQNVSKERRAAVKLAKKYVGKISYYWGGKPSGQDISGETDPNKLDCSGFIQFICSKVEGERISSVGATISISTLEKIGKEELKPGDIGLKLGTGSLYFDVDGNSYPEPGLAENANDRHVQAAKKRIEDLRGSITRISMLGERKKEKIREWKEKRLLVLKKASKLGKIQVSKSKNSFSIIEANEEDEELLEKLEGYKERYYIYGKKIREGFKFLRRCRRKKIGYRSEILEQKKVMKKYDKEVRRQIDHVGLYCGKDKNGQEIWCHCSSKGHGVVWENTDLFRYYYRYFKS